MSPEATGDDNTDSAEVEESTPEAPSLYGAPLSESCGQRVVHPSRDSWLDACAAARADGFDLLTDITAVDFLTFGAPRELPEGVVAERFEVVANLSNVTTRERIRLRVQVPGADPTLPSLFDVWPGSETPEREVYDMFGIEFSDHPDMCRVLMPDDWEGHPLRKDYAVGQIPVQFKDEGADR